MQRPPRMQVRQRNWRILDRKLHFGAPQSNKIRPSDTWLKQHHQRVQYHLVYSHGWNPDVRLSHSVETRSWIVAQIHWLGWPHCIWKGKYNVVEPRRPNVQWQQIEHWLCYKDWIRSKPEAFRTNLLQRYRSSRRHWWCSINFDKFCCTCHFDL